MFTALDTGMGVKYYVDPFRKNSERGTESPLRNALVLMEDRRVEGHYIFMGWETTETSANVQNHPATLGVIGAFGTPRK